MLTSTKENHKFGNYLGLLFELPLGMLSFALQALGIFSDLLWAPISGLVMTRLLKGKNGFRFAGLSLYIEECSSRVNGVIPFSFTFNVAAIFDTSYVLNLSAR